MKRCIRRLGALIGRLKIAWRVIHAGAPELTPVFLVGMFYGGIIAATADREVKLELEELAKRFVEGFKKEDVKTK